MLPARILTIPVELFLEILKHLDYKQILRCSCVSTPYLFHFFSCMPSLVILGYERRDIQRCTCLPTLWHVSTAGITSASWSFIIAFTKSVYTQSVGSLRFVLFSLDQMGAVVTLPCLDTRHTEIVRCHYFNTWLLYNLLTSEGISQSAVLRVFS